MIETSEPAGAIFLVSTPIGNLGDITTRATHVLSIVDVVACEDTRRTGRLLASLGVNAKRLIRLDAHTEDRRVEELMARLLAGERVALVSDAGTPSVSDPGSRIVSACHDAGVRVVAVPGPSAVLAALVASGLDTDRFAFEGFLPRKGRPRADRVAEISHRDATTILYESPRRLGPTLAELAAACGPDRMAAVARELTKLHEQVVRAPIGELAAQFAEGTRGEVVVLVGPAGPPADAEDDDIVEALVTIARNGTSRSEAVADVVTMTGAAKRRVYDLALGLDWPTLES